MVDSVQDILNTYADIISLGAGKDVTGAINRRLVQDPANQAATQLLILLWYVSAIPLHPSSGTDATLWEYGTEEQYTKALMWEVAGGHAPMTTPSQWTDPL